jgi:hypothetical protein
MSKDPVLTGCSAPKRNNHNNSARFVELSPNLGDGLIGQAAAMVG